MTRKVMMYSRSATAKENRGGTKKKSYEATLMIAASAAAPRPRRIAISATVRRNSIAILVSDKNGSNGVATKVVRAHAAIASQ